MDVCDAFLLKILAGCPPLSPPETRQLEKWWVAERSWNEGLVAFLIRQEIFRKESLKTVDFMHRGYVTFSDARHLFAMHGVERARSWSAKDDGRLPGSNSWSDGAYSQLQPDEPGDDALVRTERKPVIQGVAATHSYQVAPAEPAPAVLKPGMVLGKCLLTAEVGRGGSGVVFRGYHQALNIPVAVKVLLLNDMPRDAAVQNQLRQEARLLAQLNHPHIVRVLDFEECAAQPFLILEYVEGLSLSELIRQSGRLRWDRAARVILQVAQALEAAQRLGIVHRDVKPGNILITRDGSAKLADLGLAVVVDSLQGSHSPLDTLAGTVAYMPPEQALRSGAIDHRSDLYALGATFYHAVTGHPPFLGRTRGEVMQRHLREAPPPPAELVPGFDPALSALILKLLAKAPADRFQSYAELTAALAKIELPGGANPAAPSLGTSAEAIPGGGSERGSKFRSLWRSLIQRFKATS